MKKVKQTALVLSLATALPVMAAAPAPNGIPYPTGWQNWKVIAVSHREDNKTLRIILGNDVAVKAARQGQTNLWPDGEGTRCGHDHAGDSAHRAG